MLKNYLLWMSLGMLGMVGCGRSERVPATADAPTAARPVAPVPPAAPKPVVPAAPDAVAADALAPSPSTKSAEDARLLALVDKPRRRSATTLAAATPDESAGSDEQTALDSVRTMELSRFLQTGLPAAQEFTIDPRRDTLLMGNQGTQVLVPAYAWSLPVSTTEVRLTLREFYTPADIILAGLSTTAGTQLLETGGMVHLVATAKGQPVELLPTKPVLLRFPTRHAQPDMQLFRGVRKGHGQALDWQLPTAPRATIAAPSHRVQPRAGRRQRGSGKPIDSLYIPMPLTRWPEKTGLQGELSAQVRRQLPQLKRPSHSSRKSPLKSFLSNLPILGDQRVVHSLQLSFTVDSAGAVDVVQAPPGSDVAVNAAVVNAMRKLTSWQPAKVPYFGAGEVCREAVTAQGHITVRIRKSGEIIVYAPTWAIARASRPRAQQRQHEVRMLLADPDLRRRYLHQEDSVARIRRAREDSVARVRWAREVIRAQAEAARLRTQFTDTSRAAITQEGVYNELWAQGLQWINCDRFVGIQQIAYQVQIPQRDVIVSLIFKEINSVMPSASYSKSYAFFNRVPNGQWATVVALRRENGVTYLAKQLVQLSGIPLTSLSFHPVTMAQLRAELAAR